MELKDLCITVRGVGNMSLHQIRQDNNYTLLLMSLPLSTRIFQADSVIGSENHELINVGDSVQFTTDQDEVTVNCTLSLTLCTKL